MVTRPNNFSIGKSDFKNVVNGEYTFIDNPLFIKAVLEDSAEVILFIRPRQVWKDVKYVNALLFSKNWGRGYFSRTKHQKTLRILRQTSKQIPGDDLIYARSFIRS